MTWLVFGVSCLLVLAGAVSITSGAPIIQLERGWAEVIAGSVAVSSGGVVFALGVVLMRLEALRDAMTDAAPAGVPFAVREVALQALAHAPEPAERTAPADPSPPPSPSVAPERRYAEPDMPPVVDDARETATDQGLWKRIQRPTERIEASSSEETRRSDLRPAAPEQSPEAPRPEPIVTPEPALAIPEAEPPPPAAPSTPRPEVAMPPVEAKAEDEPGQLGWLERSLFKNRPARPSTSEVSEAPGRGARVEPVLGSAFGETATERPIGLPEPRPAPGGMFADDHAAAPTAAPADEGPTVIGRYQAGVASYVMYSDGTIEVETEGGQSHRFGSMDELKAFIANQDKAET